MQPLHGVARAALKNSPIDRQGSLLFLRSVIGIEQALANRQLSSR
jgi:hypothetical protein